MWRATRSRRACAHAPRIGPGAASRRLAAARRRSRSSTGLPSSELSERPRRMRRDYFARSSANEHAAALRDELEPRVLAMAAPELRRRPPVGHPDAARKIFRAANERRADAVRVDRHASLLELGDLRNGEPARRN